MTDTLTQQLAKQTANVNSMYDASKAAQLAKLESAYNQNLSNAQKSYNEINPAYQQKANDLGVQYERNRRNFNIQAAGNGLNTGTASQAALAQNSAFQRDYGNLRVAQQNALDEAQRGIDQLTAGYNADVNAYSAQNDYERSKALLAQQKEAYQSQLTLAANLAKYGDFSGYNGIYSDAQIKTMKNNWIASNPDLAYRTGNITAAKYKSMTGNWPAGYTPPSSGGGGGGGGGGYYASKANNGGNNQLAGSEGHDNIDTSAASKSIINKVAPTVAKTVATTAAGILASALR